MAGNESLEFSENHGSRASRLLKAGLSAVASAGASKMLEREYREKDQNLPRQYLNDREEDKYYPRHSDRRRVYHYQDRLREEEEEDLGRARQREAYLGKRTDEEDEHRHGHHHRRHKQYHYYDDDDDDEDDVATSDTSRGRRQHFREVDGNRPNRRHSFDSASSRPPKPEQSRRRRAYGHRDRTGIGSKSPDLHDAPAASKRSSMKPTHADRFGAAGQGRSRPAGGHHVHFDLSEDR